MYNISKIKYIYTYVSTTIFIINGSMHSYDVYLLKKYEHVYTQQFNTFAKVLIWII